MCEKKSALDLARKAANLGRGNPLLPARSYIAFHLQGGREVYETIIRQLAAIDADSPEQLKAKDKRIAADEELIRRFAAEERRLNARVKELEDGAKHLHSACDVLMGDSDVDDGDSALMQAMREISELIPGPW